MKKNKLFKSLLGLCVVALAGMTTACEDQPDKFEMAGGVPSISYVRLTSQESSDSLLTKAYMETTICLVGDNLRSIHRLWFNDQPAVLNTSLITDHTLIVQIPSKIPAEITDKIYMETRDGDMVDYDFTVLVPNPVITSMKNEWAPVGSEAVIYGRYFVDPDIQPLEIVLPGNNKLSHDEITYLDENEIRFIVPAEADGLSGQITVNTIYGSGTSPFYFHDTRGMMFDFDGLSPLGFDGDVWHPRTAFEDENSLSGKYIQFGDGSTTLDDNTWLESAFFAEYWAGSWNDPEFPDFGQGMKLSKLVDFSNYENMSLKFEMQIPSSSPWNSAAMQIVFAPSSTIHVQGASWDFFNGPEDVQAPRAMYRPWQGAASGDYHTNGEWVTVTIPFSAFVNNFEGGAAVNGFTGPDSFDSFQISIVGGGINTEKECTPIIRIDNIRAVVNL